MSHRAKLIVIMGVSGCGKSSVAHALAKHLNYEYVEADDFHSEENKQSMANGKALTDAMREPWLALLQSHLKRLAEADHNCVMAFSGLRRIHRDRIRDLRFDVQFLHLEGDQRLISKRMAERAGHFMPASLLDSQFEALETTYKEADINSISIDQVLDSVIADALDIVSINVARHSDTVT